MLNSFYVYAHFTPGAQFPFYIGKGKGKRAWVSSNRSNWWKSTTNKYGLEVRILFSNLTEQMAFFLEKEMISRYGVQKEGSGCLINITLGGGGISGYKHTDETKQKIGMASKGKTLSKEHIKKLKAATKGRVVPIEVIRRMAEKKRGTIASEETRRKIGNSHRGKTRSTEARNNLSRGQGATFVKLIHVSGIIENVLNRAEFCRKYHLHPRCIRHVIQQKVKSHNGWSLFREL